jgi:hypothetical protein
MSLAENFSRPEKVTILASFRDKLANSAVGKKWGMGRIPMDQAPEGVEQIFQIADELAGSPEEWTDLTGIKLGMQPQGQ